jgi:hypothetical protein
MQSEHDGRAAGTGARRNQRLSSNWRWRDYSDLPEEGDEDEPDSADDDEFQLVEESRSRHSSALLDSEMESEDDEEEVEYTEASPQRRSQRYAAMRDSDDEDLVEFMSTNNTPFGPFAGDYETYFFKMPESRARHVSREWLRRVESNSSYAGRRCYAPQLGDTVVYIPRAHQETISAFPSLAAPWQEWPEEAAWPVVQCCIRHIRYRFPFKAYRYVTMTWLRP